MNRYAKIAADIYHEQLKSVADMRPGYWGGVVVALYLNDHAIGAGTLRYISKARKHVGTEGVALRYKFRNKGHGIRLYLAIIDAAKELGATRIYSHDRLNKFSRRMWSEKLAAIFEVKGGRRGRCGCKRCRYHQRGRYYIDLNTTPLRKFLNMELP